MKDINDIYFDFVTKFKIITEFISKNFGEKDILIRKNQGLIPTKYLNIKESIVKGYIFHGSGCDFRFKECLLDIEFDNNIVGFTDWSFISFVKTINPEANEEDIKMFLNSKVNKNEIGYNYNVYWILPILSVTQDTKNL